MHTIKMPVRAALKSSCALALAVFLAAPVYSQSFSYVPGIEAELLQPVEGNLISPGDINTAGDVVGQADYNWASRATLWPADGSAPVRLDNSNEFDENNSYANAINDSGQIVGNFRGATLWLNNQATLLDSSGSAFDINNNGVIAGESRQFNASTRAVIWQNQSISLLGGEPDGLESTARAINNNGDVGGAYFSTSGYVRIHAPALWSNGQLIDLGKLPNFTKQAFVNDLNDFNQIVGTSTNTDTPSASRAVIWQNGLVASLGTLGGEYSTATKINNAGQIAGYSAVIPGETFTASSEIHPILWQDGVMYDLAPAVNQTCIGTDKCLAFAHSINDSGQVIVSVTDSNGRAAYKLTISDLSQLPSVSAPLNFVTPVGADGSNPFVVDLALTMQATPDPVQVDGLLTYDINVTNNGGIPGHNVSVDLPIPNNVTYESATNSRHILVCTNYINGGRTTRVLCNFGTMDIGDTESIQLVVRPNSKGTLSRTATATSDEDDADTSDNSVTVTTTVESGGDPVPDPDPTPGNEAPTADAGSDQTVGPRDKVYMDGGGSSDADGTIASYRWQQISGKKVSIKNANSAVANFSAPGVKRGRTKVLVFELTVTDNDGATASDQVTVTVTR